MREGAGGSCLETIYVGAEGRQQERARGGRVSGVGASWRWVVCVLQG